MSKFNNESLTQLLKDGEAAIRSGKGHEVRHHLDVLNTAQIPDAFRLPLANLSRRVGLITLALRILAPRMALIDLGRSEKVTPGEMAEYALLLQRIGSLAEAHRLLDQVDSEVEPTALLYRAFCFFKVWEHKKSIPYLQDYVDNIEDTYQQLVGRLNLAAAYCIAGDYDTSLQQTELCLAKAHTDEKWRLYANALELKSQNLIHLKNISAAEKNILEADKILKAHNTFDALFVKKWLAFIEAQKNESAEPLMEFKEQAFKEQAYESAREADLYSLMIIPDPNIWDHVYFGTPFAAYRKRIENLTGVGPSTDVFYYGDVGSPILDVPSGTFKDEVVLPLGKKIHLTLEMFTRDLYRPLKMGDMFSILYPGEHFDINSSPERIYQVIKRTRQYLQDSELPLEIHESAGFYNLQKIASITIKLYKTRKPIDGLHPYLAQLKSMYPHGHTFKASDVRESLDLKLSKAREVLELGINSGEIKRLGSSSATKYQFVTNSESN